MNESNETLPPPSHVQAAFLGALTILLIIAGFSAVSAFDRKSLPEEYEIDFDTKTRLEARHLEGIKEAGIQDISAEQLNGSLKVTVRYFTRQDRGILDGTTETVSVARREALAVIDKAIIKAPRNGRTMEVSLRGLEGDQDFSYESKYQALDELLELAFEVVSRHAGER